MNILKIAAPAAAAAVALLAGAGANAASLTVSGSVPNVCTITATPTGSFNIQSAALQPVANITATCNTAGNHSITVQATNGQFNGPQNVDYTVSMDLDGPLLPFDADNLTTAAVTRSIGAVTQNLGLGLGGHFSVKPLSQPYMGGTYSEPWAITIG